MHDKNNLFMDRPKEMTPYIDFGHLQNIVIYIFKHDYIIVTLLQVGTHVGFVSFLMFFHDKNNIILKTCQLNKCYISFKISQFR